MAFKPQTPPSGESPPLIRYLREEFGRVAQAIRAVVIGTLQLYVAKGYGGLHLRDSIGLTNIGTIWQPLLFDVVTPTTPFDVVANLANESLAIQRGGIWQINFMTSIQHDELNAGRIMQFRMQNITLGTTLLEWITGTGRNVNFTTFSTSVQVDINGPQIGDEFQIQVSGSVYSAVIQYSGEFSVNSISELQDIAA